VKRKQDADDVLDMLLDSKAAKASSSSGKEKGKGLEVPPLDNLDAIANLISGSSGAQGQVSDLRSAIKQKGAKKQRPKK
jgi:hypothetical protein